MARLRCDFDSKVLRLSTSMTVLLPQNFPPRAAGFPTLYLLHGISDDDTSWGRYSSVERYAGELGLAVVMPQVHRSFYTDEEYGYRFWTFLSEELPAVAGSFFRLSEQREDTYVAGLSMGGYGALKWALRVPERFAAAASLSGATDLVGRQEAGGPANEPGLTRRVLGDQPVAGTANDLSWLLEQADPAKLPALYLGCGTEDPLHPENVAFRDAATAHGIPLTVHFGPGGHGWDYWDAQIQDVLAWLPVDPAYVSGRLRE